MEHFYLLDTNILSDFIRHPTGKIFTKIQEIGEETVCTSIIVACELEFGAEKKNSQRLKQRIRLAFNMIPVLSLTHEVSSHYAKARTYPTLTLPLLRGGNISPLSKGGLSKGGLRGVKIKATKFFRLTGKSFHLKLTRMKDLRPIQWSNLIHNFSGVSPVGWVER